MVQLIGVGVEGQQQCQDGEVAVACGNVQGCQTTVVGQSKVGVGGVEQGVDGVGVAHLSGEKDGRVAVVGASIDEREDGGVLQKLVESGGVVGFGGVVEGQAIEFGGGGGHLVGVLVGWWGGVAWVQRATVAVLHTHTYITNRTCTT